MKIYTTQIIKEQVLNDDFKVVLTPIKSYSKDGHAYIDITATAGSQFAPSWKDLKALKAGTISKADYKASYHAKMSINCKADRKAWEWLQSRKSIVLACYCKPGAFCHRYLFADILEKCFMVDRLGELTTKQVKHWLHAFRSDDTTAGEQEQRREIENIFLQDPESNKPLATKEFYKPFERKPFFNDNWIFQGTDNDSNPIIEDIFSSREGTAAWTGETDADADRSVIEGCKNATPLKYGDIGAVAISKKFKEGESIRHGQPFKTYKTFYLVKPHCGYCAVEPAQIEIETQHTPCQQSQKIGQLDRIIYEDCVKTGGNINILQLTKEHAVSIPSHLQVDKIAQFAGISLRNAAVIARCYKELDISFKDAIKLNKAIKHRKVKAPWDIIAFNGMTLIDWVLEMKQIDILAELKDASDPQYDDWMHYEDGIFSFKIIDDMAASAPADLQEIPFVPFDDNSPTYYKESDLDEYTDSNKVNLFTYWNNSVIKTPKELLDSKTARTFKKMRIAILDNNLKPETLKKFKKIIRKFTPAQKLGIKRAIQIKA